MKHSIIISNKIVGLIAAIILSTFMISCGSEKDDFEMPSEEVLEKVAAATQFVDQLFSESSSIDEFEKHLDEIRNTEGVVDAWTNNQTMYVEYEALGKLLYYYSTYPVQVKEEQTRSYSESNMSIINSFYNAKTRESTVENIDIEDVHHKSNESDKHSIVIYNAVYTDKGHQSDTRDADELARLCEKDLNYGKENVRVIKDTDHSYGEFFNNEMFKYDLVFLIMHGNCYKGWHWYITGQRYTGFDNNMWYNAICQLITKPINTIYEGIVDIKEKDSNGIEHTCYYWYITDDYLSQITNKFNGPSVVFNVACHSLDTNNNTAYAFCNMGASSYLGYDNTNTIGVSAGIEFFKGLFNGLSAQTSFDQLGEKYTHDTTLYNPQKVENGNYLDLKNGSYLPVPEGTGDTKFSRCNARLHIVTRSNNDIDKHLCITHPVTDENYEEKGPYVVLKGSILIADPNNDNEYGFALRKKDSKYFTPIKPGIKYKTGNTNTSKCSFDKESHTLTFEYAINKSEFKDVENFCAYLYDGEKYCIGDFKEIIVKEGVSCPDDNHPHAIDLGLPSGNKWSCCLLGESEPSTSNQKYPWGYTTPVDDNYIINYMGPDVYYGYKYGKRVTYYQGTYHCEDDCFVFLGDDISGTEYDAVYVSKNWGDGWVMPNLNDFQELVNNCAFEGSGLHKKIIGPNGNYIDAGPFDAWSSTLGPINSEFPKPYMCAYLFSPYEGKIMLELRNEAFQIWPVYKKPSGK